eukprot:JP444609.1.p1 GENE.JP444609.1~~JP444609.1.p1  ORF type:complete len:55 (+),score=10.39 JP444609.1:1-165(+)
MGQSVNPNCVHLARKRAESCAEYLLNSWEISEDRIEVVSRADHSLKMCVVFFSQ